MWFQKGFWPKTHPQWILFGSSNSIANHPQVFHHTYSHREQHIARQRFCAENPSIPTPVTSNPCLILDPTKQKAFDSWLGSNIYRPLRIGLETSHESKKSCLGQKESFSAQDLIRKIQVRIRQHELSPGLNAPE